jgi:ABC-type phosphate transport system substrate-binding protein
LEPVATALPSALPAAPAGFRKFVSATPPPEPAYAPAASLPEVAAAVPARPIIIAPIAPIKPPVIDAFEDQPDHDDRYQSPAATQLENLLAQHRSSAPPAGPPETDEPAEELPAAASLPPVAPVEPSESADETATVELHAPETAPDLHAEPAPEPREAEAPVASPAHAAAAPAHEPASNAWVIKPLESGELEPAGDTADAKPKNKRAIYAGIAAAAILALGGAYYAASNGVITIPGIPGFSTVAAAGALPATPTFRICSSPGVADKLVPDLVRTFLTKEGASAVDASPAKGTYSAQLPNRTPALISVSTTDAAQAYAGLVAGTCQLAITQGQMPAKLRASKNTIGETVLGLAGVGVVVNGSNTVAQLDVDQLAKIFSGSVTNWSQVGGPNTPIAIVLPPAQSDEFDALKTMVLKSANVASSAKHADAVASVAALVAKTPGAIGVTSLATTSPAHLLRIVTRDGTPIAASTVNVGLKRYPLTTTVYAYDTSQNADPLAAQFLSYTQSDAGQTVVSNSNFVGRNSF